MAHFIGSSTSAPTCEALEFRTKFADYRTKVALASPMPVR
jgi:hypothetical protein